MDAAHTLYEKFIGSNNPKIIIDSVHEIKKHFSNVSEKEPTDEIGEELLYLLGGKKETFEWQLLITILFINDEKLGEYLEVLKNKIDQISYEQSERAKLILKEIHPKINKVYIDKFSDIITLLDKIKPGKKSKMKKEKNIEKKGDSEKWYEIKTGISIEAQRQSAGLKNHLGVKACGNCAAPMIVKEEISNSETLWVCPNCGNSIYSTNIPMKQEEIEKLRDIFRKK